MVMSCCAYEEPSPLEREHMNKCFHFERKGIIVANPLVFGSSFVCLWTFVIACCVEPDYMGKAMSYVAFEWIPDVWTWLYIISQNLWVLVLLWAAAFYGRIKLGKDEDKPEFTNATWFSMLFCSGLATGLFYYAVAEPVWHYTGSGRFTEAKGYGNMQETATRALEVTYYHWGLHGWIPYSVMGSLMGIMTYRRGFPLTVRYCFYPIIGDACYGLMGDIVDALSIITSICGVCTSLGLGAMQMNTGMQRLSHGFYRGVNYGIPNEAKYADPTCGGVGKICGEGLEPYGIQQTTANQTIIILAITSLATISVVLGLKVGIKLLSQFVFAMGMGLTMVVLFHGETWYCLDAMVQSFGYYVWDIVRLGNWCDAWLRLGPKDMGLGGLDDTTVSRGFISGWTLFYWGWWISWGPFVGTFLAKISKGRELREFVAATLIVPTVFTVLWFGTWGGEGIRMQRMAVGSKVCSIPELAKTASVSATSLCSMPKGASGSLSTKCAGYSGALSTETKKKYQIGWTPPCVLDPSYHGGYGKCKEFAWTRVTTVGDRCVKTTSWVKVPCGGKADPTGAPTDHGACKGTITDADLTGGSKTFNHFPVADQPDCFVPAQDGIVCIANQATEDILFDQLSSYGPRGFSDLLSVIALLCLMLYFVTSSDSGSLVVDILSSNGHPEPPVFQRIFWSFTEGTTGIALLVAGSSGANAKGALTALQAAAIIMGLPYTIILFYATYALALAVKEEAGLLDRNRKGFHVFIFNFKLWKRHILNLLVPGLALGRAVSECGKWPGAETFSKKVISVLWCIIFSGLYYVPVLLEILGVITLSWEVVGGVIYCGFAVLCGLVRYDIRMRFAVLHGDLFTDMLCGLVIPCFTISQIEYQLDNDDAAASKKLENQLEF